MSWRYIKTFNTAEGIGPTDKSAGLNMQSQQKTLHTFIILLNKLGVVVLLCSSVPLRFQFPCFLGCRGGGCLEDAYGKDSLFAAASYVQVVGV
eukprot:5099008-Amphidinium_carterae.1